MTLERGEATAGQKLNRTGEIASWIRGEIESGAIQPGARLEEGQLSKQFGVSKTPVREALIQLSSIGFVELRQRRGATVSVMSVEQVISMFELMAEMESMAAKLAAVRMSPQSRAMLAATYESSAEVIDDAERYDQINRQLHEHIYRGACNEYLEAGIKDMRARLRVYRRYPFQRPGRILQSHDDHGKIIAAIFEGDGAAASRLMQNHMTTGGRIFADLVAALARKP